MTPADWRVEKIPRWKRYAFPSGEVVHYARELWPINSFGAKQGWALCGRKLWLPESRDDLRVCEDCWTRMVADETIDTTPPDREAA